MVFRRKIAGVVLGGHHFRCRLARTPEEHTRGLQNQPPLDSNEGMLFMLGRPRAASFHMGRVAFPIDIVFAHKGKVAKVVHDVQPGQHGNWSATPVDQVIELPGGTCRKLGIAPPLPQYYYTVEIPHEVGDDPKDDPDRERDPTERYPSSTPDESSPLSDQMKNKYWQNSWGYDPTNPDFAEGDGPGLRMSAQLIADPGEYVGIMLEAMAHEERPLDWHRDALNSQLSYAVVTPEDVTRWLKQYDLSGSEMTDVHAAATSKRGMRLLGDGLIIAGIADSSKVTEQDVLILWRTRNGERI